MENQSDQHPFGDYVKNRFARVNRSIVRQLFARYKKMCEAQSVRGFVQASCAASAFIDKHLNAWPRLLGGTATAFATFRGYFLEEVTLQLARRTIRRAKREGELAVVKLSTGGGIVTGLSLAFRRGRLPQHVPIVFRRDREDVVVGFRRVLSVSAADGSRIEFPDELIPVIVLACKMYIDATRLENVLAKAKSLYGQFSNCSFLVVAEWDALGDAWHDRHGRVLDSLFAPVEQMLFLRGEDARRPNNKVLRKASLASPYRPKVLREIALAIDSALEHWEK